MICTFFGHRYVAESIQPVLRSTLIDLIENKNTTLFYVGNHGGFDAMVYRVLRELAAIYPISYYVVLAYMPQKRNPWDTTDYSVTLLPEGVETVPRQFAIIYRNKWMLRQADYVVTYVTSHIGSGAAKFKTMGMKWGKTVIELADTEE